MLDEGQLITEDAYERYPRFDIRPNNRRWKSRVRRLVNGHRGFFLMVDPTNPNEDMFVDGGGWVSFLDEDGNFAAVGTHIRKMYPDVWK